MTEAGPQQRRRSVPVDVGGVLVLLHSGSWPIDRKSVV